MMKVIISLIVCLISLYFIFKFLRDLIYRMDSRSICFREEQCSEDLYIASNYISKKGSGDVVLLNRWKTEGCPLEKSMKVGCRNYKCVYMDY